MNTGVDREKEAIAIMALLTFAERRSSEIHSENAAQFIKLAISELALENGIKTSSPVESDIQALLKNYHLKPLRQRPGARRK